MKYRRSLILLVCGACLTALAQPILVPTLGPRFKQTRDRVEEMFRYRNGKAPELDPKVNLFRISSHNTESPEVPVQTTKQEPEAPDEVILKLAIATLKAATIITGDGRAYLVVDGKKRYEEGDFITATVRGKPVRLLVKRVGQNTATLAYNSAETVAKF
jgi:hypothetical protein